MSPEFRSSRTEKQRKQKHWNALAITKSTILILTEAFIPVHTPTRIHCVEKLVVAGALASQLDFPILICRHRDCLLAHRPFPLPLHLRLITHKPSIAALFNITVATQNSASG
ncbi:hypothetical protein [Paraburkholderia adhaesiva]|uniref:hypothetical protein n=1 Tax=Paraburkholderia adhaesiva TaxID=2883244 RepID=UPI001F217F8F|nr:hypothetical protein [Paraburkholderia adhaesiva]